MRRPALLLEWTPAAFEYPRIEPRRGPLDTVKPIPYRPFKWGEYQCVLSTVLSPAVQNDERRRPPARRSVTMGIRSMPWDEWIEVGTPAPSLLAIE